MASNNDNMVNVEGGDEDINPNSNNISVPVLDAAADDKKNDDAEKHNDQSAVPDDTKNGPYFLRHDSRERFLSRWKSTKWSNG